MSRMSRTPMASAPIPRAQICCRDGGRLQKLDQFTPPVPPALEYRQCSDPVPARDSPRRPNGDFPRDGIGRLRSRICSLPAGRYQPDVTQNCKNPQKPYKHRDRSFRLTGTVPAKEREALNPQTHASGATLPVPCTLKQSAPLSSTRTCPDKHFPLLGPLNTAKA